MLGAGSELGRWIGAVICNRRNEITARIDKLCKLFFATELRKYVRGRATRAHVEKLHEGGAHVSWGVEQVSE